MLKLFAFLAGVRDPISYENATGNRNAGRPESVSLRIRATKDVPASVGHAPTACHIQEARQEANNQRTGPDLLDDAFPDLVGVEVKAHHRQAGDGTQVEPASVQRLLEKTVSAENEDRPAYYHSGTY